ncbi:RNA-binding protein NOB1-like [Amphiura filiformis]|uniref:RNA-binding protein NOB1-like n=1 Tax=Amphiura filiformis TaxID=82378 RepID=UPI003B223948
MAKSQVKHVVVDAIAFFKNIQLQEIAENVYTSYGVVNEIRDSATRQRLAVLPYELKCKEPSSEAIQFVSDFARKTGDYSTLSAVDLRVLALAYQITKEQLGDEAFKQKEDKQHVSGNDEKPFGKATNVVGFVYPKAQSKGSPKEEVTTEEHKVDEELTERLNQLNTSDSTSATTSADGNIELTLSRLDDQTSDQQDVQTKSSAQATNSSLGESGEQVNSSILRTSDDQKEGVNDENLRPSDQDELEEKGDLEETEEDEEQEEEEDDDDDEGWITPSNLEEAHKGMGGLDEEAADIVVGCMTTDFAMQNVLIQMGIPVLSVDGLRIRRAKSFVLRCYGCFKTTSNTSKKFCPGCGNQSLTKVSVSVDENTGKQHLHFSKHKVISTRGMKYPLPAPKGGKHADNPLLVADQPQPLNHLPRKARKGTDVFDPDFVTNASPFAVNDVTSRSAQLGVRHLSSNSSHSRRNPNENKRKRKGKKK